MFSDNIKHVAVRENLVSFVTNDNRNQPFAAAQAIRQQNRMYNMRARRVKMRLKRLNEEVLESQYTLRMSTKEKCCTRDCLTQFPLERVKRIREEWHGSLHQPLYQKTRTEVFNNLWEKMQLLYNDSQSRGKGESRFRYSVDGTKVCRRSFAWLVGVSVGTIFE